MSDNITKATNSLLSKVEDRLERARKDVNDCRLMLAKESKADVGDVLDDLGAASRALDHAIIVLGAEIAGDE